MWIWRIWNLTHCWWECEMEQPLWKSIWQVFKNFNVELPAVPLLVICPPKTLKTTVQTKSCTWTFIAALVTISKKYKQPKCSAVDWLTFWSYISTLWILFRYGKDEVILQHRWASVVSESQAQKTTYSVYMRYTE